MGEAAIEMSVRISLPHRLALEFRWRAPQRQPLGARGERYQALGDRQQSVMVAPAQKIGSDASDARNHVPIPKRYGAVPERLIDLTARGVRFGDDPFVETFDELVLPAAVPRKIRGSERQAADPLEQANRQPVFGLGPSRRPFDPPMSGAIPTLIGKANVEDAKH